MQPTRADPRLDTATAGYGRTVAVVYRCPDCDGDVDDEVEADTAVFTGGYRRSDAVVQVRLRDPEAPGEAGVDITVHIAGAPIPARVVLIDPGAGYDAGDWAESREHDAAYAWLPSRRRPGAHLLRRGHAHGTRAMIPRLPATTTPTAPS